MTHPVITISRDSDFSSLYLAMIKNRLHHLVFTENGTTASPITGIVSDHDILLSQGFPAVIIYALMNTMKVSELARLRDQAELLLKYFLENELSIDFVASIISEINDVIVQRAVTIAKIKYAGDFQDVNMVKFCFLTLGSEGRGEQLLRTDMDNAIVYDDVGDEEKERTKEYLLLIAGEVIDILIHCGFHPCPAYMMANNPEWCQPLSKWKGYFDYWILNPDQDSLLKVSIFFDFRGIYGTKELAKEMTEYIY